MTEVISKKYMWRDGYRYKKDANIVGQVLTEIEERDGFVTSESFLEESRPEEAETHDMFEWRDSIAAEKYRLDQARKILLQITYTVVRDEERTGSVELVEAQEFKPHSGWVNVSRKGMHGTPAKMVSIELAAQDRTMWKQVLANAVAEMTAATNKYRSFKEFRKVFAELDKVKEELQADSK